VRGLVLFLLCERFGYCLIQYGGLVFRRFDTKGLRPLDPGARDVLCSQEGDHLIKRKENNTAQKWKV
jgi:hypothetical protein